jgi:hypothetical protein
VVLPQLTSNHQQQLVDCFASSLSNQMHQVARSIIGVKGKRKGFEEGNHWWKHPCIQPARDTLLTAIREHECRPDNNTKLALARARLNWYQTLKEAKNESWEELVGKMERITCFYGSSSIARFQSRLQICLHSTIRPVDLL